MKLAGEQLWLSVRRTKSYNGFAVTFADISRMTPTDTEGTEMDFRYDGHWAYFPIHIPIAMLIFALIWRACDGLF